MTVASLTLREAERAVKSHFARQGPNLGRGRQKPYTEAGLARVPCRRCGKPSSAQWHLRPCALGSGAYAWYGLCREHDLELNRIVVTFMGVPGGEAMLERYAAR